MLKRLGRRNSLQRVHPEHPVEQIETEALLLRGRAEDAGARRLSDQWIN